MSSATENNNASSQPQEITIKLKAIDKEFSVKMSSAAKIKELKEKLQEVKYK